MYLLKHFLKCFYQWNWINWLSLTFSNSSFWQRLWRYMYCWDVVSVCSSGVSLFSFNFYATNNSQSLHGYSLKTGQPLDFHLVRPLWCCSPKKISSGSCNVCSLRNDLTEGLARQFRAFIKRCGGSEKRNTSWVLDLLLKGGTPHEC